MGFHSKLKMFISILSNVVYYDIQVYVHNYTIEIVFTALHAYYKYIRGKKQHFDI